MKRIIISFWVLMFFNVCTAQDFQLINNNKGAAIYYRGQDKVVHTAIEILIGDSKLVCKDPFERSEKIHDGAIIVGVPDKDPEFKRLLTKYKVDITGIDKK